MLSYAALTDINGHLSALCMWSEYMYQAKAKKGVSVPDQEALSISQPKMISHFILEKLFVMPKQHINLSDLKQVQHQSCSDPEG